LETFESTKHDGENMKHKAYNSYLIYILHIRRSYRHNHKFILKSSKILTFF